MRKIKKLLASLMAMAMISAIATVPASANTFIYEKEANALYTLGLYKGISEVKFEPDLGTNLDRQTGVVMLLRMFGQEEEAKELTYEEADEILSVFKDSGNIANWSKRQVAYAVEKGYVKGYAEDSTFRPTAGLNGKAYCSLILQQLGYDGDFQYNKAATKLSEVGGLTSIQANLFNSDTTINKDFLVGISYGTLQAVYKADGEKLIKKLVDKGIVSAEKVREVGIEFAMIVSVESIDDITVTVGETPKLPSSVEVEYDDGTKGTASVSWPKVDTSKAGEQTVSGTISGTSITAKVKIIVVPDKLTAKAVSSGNLKEVIVEFSRAVENENEAKNKSNYDVEGNSVLNAELSEDKTTVTLLLKNALKQQSDVEVRVDKKVGLDKNAVLQIMNIKDLSVPEVVDVTAVGNSLLKLTFSEPVQNAENVSSYAIDGKSFAAQLSLSANEKTVNIKLTKRLTSGSHKLTVKDKISDYAGYMVEDDEVKFTVLEDDEAPTAKVISATQTKVVIKFSEEIEDPDIDDVSTSVRTRIEDMELDEDNKTLTIYFDVDNALPVAGCNIIIEDVTDYSGNSTDIKLKVIPEIDDSSPEFVGYVIKNQKEIVLEFSEEILSNTGEFKLKDSDGDTIALSKAEYYKENGEYVRTKLVLKRDDGEEFESGNYDLTISGVTDLSPFKNQIDKETVKITVEDKTPPEVSNVYINTDNNQLFIKFSEDVDKGSATDYSNYFYFVDGIAKKLDKSLIKLELLNDDQTVCITFPSDKDDYEDDEIVDVKKISRIQVESVKDLKGNSMSVASISSGSFKDTGSTAPQIVSAVVTDTNTIVVKIKGSIDASTLDPDDFYITAGKDKSGYDIVITAWDAKYDENKNEITLTVNTDIDTDGTFDGKTIYLDLEDEEYIDTVNVFNQKLTISSRIKVEEDFKPVAKLIDAAYYEKGVGTVVFIRLSENLKLSDGDKLNENDSSQFRVKVNGKTVDAKIYYYDAEAKDDKYTDEDETFARFKVVIDGNYRGDKVQVIFYRATKATIIDDSGNALDDFSFTATVD